MSYPYDWVNGEYPLDIGSGESIDGGRNNYPVIGEEEEKGPERVGNQRDFPAYESEQHDIQGYLEGHLHQQQSPAMGGDDWQMNRSHSSQQFFANYDSQFDLDPRNPASHHDPQPQEVVPSGRDAQLACRSQSPDSNSAFVFVPGFGNDPGLATECGMTTYGEKSSKLEVELGYDWLTESDMVVDHEPSAWIHAVTAAEEQFEHTEGPPWSTENQHNEHSGLTIAQLNLLDNMAGASETSCASQDGVDTSNLTPPTSGSTGDDADRDWGENSVATLRPTDLPPVNSLDHARFTPNHVNHNEQVQGFVTPPTGYVAGRHSAHGYSIPYRTAHQDTSLTESNSDRDRLDVPTPETSSSSPSSLASSAMLDPLLCLYCSAQFTGIHRRGNYGRHRRQKHVGRPTELACENEYCDKMFQRADARLKHYRRQHPELVPGSS